MNAAEVMLDQPRATVSDYKDAEIAELKMCNSTQQIRIAELERCPPTAVAKAEPTGVSGLYAEFTDAPEGDAAWKLQNRR
jgi:hypothetical protein